MKRLCHGGQTPMAQSGPEGAGAGGACVDHRPKVCFPQSKPLPAEPSLDFQTSMAPNEHRQKRDNKHNK